MKKYNLALIPKKESKKFIDIAGRFSDMANSYCLGNNSLPHVTIRHFNAKKKDLEQYWKQFQAKVQPNTLNLTFNEFSCLTFDNRIYYASLLPDYLEQLFKMHEIASGILNEKIKPNYDPHLTLFDTKDTSYIDRVNEYKKSYAPIQDELKLSIGLSDGLGQYLSVLKSI